MTSKNEPIPDFIQPLLRITDGYPTDAVHAAIERHEEAVPHLLSDLRRLNEEPGYALADPRYMLHIYALFILGYLKEPKALEPVLEIARNPEAVDALGDITTCGFAEILANLCLERPEELYLIIENKDIDTYVRSSALQAIGILHHAQKLSREALASYLAELYETKLERRATYVWDAAIALSTDFVIAEHLGAIKEAYANGYADDFVDLREDVEIALAGKREDPYRLDEYHLLRHPDEELQFWHCFDRDWDPDQADEEDDWEDELFKDDTFGDETETTMLDFGKGSGTPPPAINKNIVASGSTFKRDTKKVGRNDPCPCGSGKKYKKCCGA